LLVKKILTLIEKRDINVKGVYMENKNSIIRKYNYNLETGTVGTDDDNIAAILFNINKMEKRISFKTSDLEELKRALGELFAIITDCKVYLNRFLKIFSDKIKEDTVNEITSILDNAMKISRAATREACQPNMEKICEVFSEIYYIVLKAVPFVLALDDQAVGRL